MLSTQPQNPATILISICIGGKLLSGLSCIWGDVYVVGVVTSIRVDVFGVADVKNFVLQVMDIICHSVW